MQKPNAGDALTQTQVNEALNITYFPDSKPGNKKWHYGQLEAWAYNFGYADGMPIYANVEPGGYHIYFLNDGHKAPIILKLNETPETYYITPM